MNDNRLLELNGMGLIPGPTETESEFIRRVDYCLKLHANWPGLNSLKEFDSIKTIGEFSEEALAKTTRLYGINPIWIPLFFSNYQLMPWHGGTAWIFQENDDLPTSAFFQLKKIFQKNRYYLGIYDREELIAHEISHVGRMMFEEPKFEELIAYRSSSSPFRRFFGSIVQSSNESMIFVLLMFLILCFDFFLIAFDYDEAFQYGLWLKLVPLSLIGYGCIRLWYRQRQFRKALQNIKSAIKKEEDAEAVVYRLTDKEIELFSRLSPSQILDYIDEHKDKSLRLRLISLAYTSLS